jgi:hypothetical protein
MADGGSGRDADHIDGVPWVLVMVRAWNHEGRVVVRMTRSVVGRAPQVCVEASSAAAGRRLTQWLDDPSARLVDPPRDNAPEDVAETARQRSGSGAAPTLRLGLRTAVDGHGPSDREPEVGQPEAPERRDKET